MKFYEISDDLGQIVGCELSKSAAIETAESYYRFERFSISMIDAPVNADTVRRLIGQIGGYAFGTKTVYIKE